MSINFIDDFRMRIPEYSYVERLCFRKLLPKPNLTDNVEQQVPTHHVLPLSLGRSKSSNARLGLAHALSIYDSIDGMDRW